jgi:putative transposase
LFACRALIRWTAAQVARVDQPRPFGFYDVARSVVDAFTRRVVGWRMADTLHTEVVLEALEMALHTRKPTDVIHHSDRGCQYTRRAFGRLCREAGAIPSMGSVGDAYDNAMAESFFATLEKELIARNSWKERTQARLSVLDYIEGSSNPRRRHSSLSGCPEQSSRGGC